MQSTANAKTVFMLIEVDNLSFGKNVQKSK